MQMQIPIKQHKARIMLRVFAGIAKPNPKMGQALGPLGINMMQFCKEFNAQTTDFRTDVPMRVELWAFHDRTFKFKLRAPETSWFIKKAIGKEKCSQYPGYIINDEIGVKYIYEIAKVKQEVDQDLRRLSLQSICKMIAAQCHSMGVMVTIDTEKPDIVKPHLKI